MTSQRRRIILALLSALIPACLLSGQETPRGFADLASKANAARDANNPQSAIELYKQALSLNPGWQEGLWMLGSLQYEGEAYADGAQSLRRLVALRPAAAPAWALLGLCEYEAHDYPSSLEHIRKGLSLGIVNQPQMTAVLRFHEALLLTRARQFDEALRLYADLVSGKVADEQLLLGLGLTLLRQGATPAEIAPDRKDLILSAGRAQAAVLAHSAADARNAYGELVARYPNEAGVHYAYGYFLFSADPERAIAEWNRALSIDPSHEAAHGMLAWALWLRAENQLALTHARVAVEKDPDLFVGQIVLGRLLAASGQAKVGIEHLERARSLDPKNLEVHLALATAYSEAGRRFDSQRERQLCMKMQAEAGAVEQP